MSRHVETSGADSLSVPDRVLYALFARHADRSRHELDRRRYRGTDLKIGFDVFLARVYGLSWFVSLLVVAPAIVVLLALPEATLSAVADFLVAGVPLLEEVGVPVIPRGALAVGCALTLSWGGHRTVIRLGGLYLRWVSAARKTNIERTLPGAVRYLNVLSSGSDGNREMLRKVADTGAYGETAISLRKALNTAALTGSVNDGLRRVARDTPSRNVLAPFLLKFREHAEQGADALANYLRMESRMLAHRQDRARQRAEGFLELFAEMFLVLLVLPSLLVIVLTVMSVIAPGLSKSVSTPVGETTVRAAVVYGSAAFITTVGIGASLLVSGLRPPDQTVRYRWPPTRAAYLTNVGTNPISAGVVLTGPALLVAGALYSVGYHPVNVALLGYACYAIPVGAVAVRRAHLDDAKDREIKDFVHAVSGHVSLGRPFPRAVEHVARDVELGPLEPDVADLALNLNFTTRDPRQGEANLRTAALDRFVDRVGTPLAEQTIGLVTGALDAGSDTETVFETLQTEIGRLYHEKRALRSNLLVYVAIGWTTAILVIGITVAVSLYVFEGFAQLSSLSGSVGYTIDPGAIQPPRDRFRIYVVTQTTMLASGWFSGTASRGYFEALLHSGVLVLFCYVVFAGAGLI
ncbi:MAG: type II secretion system F family protein [Halobacteriota archaeon]